MLAAATVVCAAVTSAHAEPAPSAAPSASVIRVRVGNRVIERQFTVEEERHLEEMGRKELEAVRFFEDYQLRRELEHGEKELLFLLLAPIAMGIGLVARGIREAR